MLSRHEDGALYAIDQTLRRFRSVSTRQEARSLAASIEYTARALRESIERDGLKPLPPPPPMALLPSYTYRAPSYLKPEPPESLILLWSVGMAVVVFAFLAIVTVVSHS